MFAGKEQATGGRADRGVRVAGMDRVGRLAQISRELASKQVHIAIFPESRLPKFVRRIGSYIVVSSGHLPVRCKALGIITVWISCELPSCIEASRPAHCSTLDVTHVRPILSLPRMCIVRIAIDNLSLFVCGFHAALTINVFFRTTITSVCINDPKNLYKSLTSPDV